MKIRERINKALGVHDAIWSCSGAAGLTIGIISMLEIEAVSFSWNNLAMFSGFSFLGMFAFFTFIVVIEACGRIKE